jgi:hypothetical protein
LARLFTKTSPATLVRNIRLLEGLCLAKTRKSDHFSVCQKLTSAALEALRRIDKDPESFGWRYRNPDRKELLASMARAISSVDQDDLLSSLAGHAHNLPKIYPLDAQVAAIIDVYSWLKKQRRKAGPAFSNWLQACKVQLESLTADEPVKPTDFRRSAPGHCDCADCKELKAFLINPQEKEHRFRVKEERRRHLEMHISRDCDLDCRTERTSSPHTLVCTKNTATYDRHLKTYHENKERLKNLRAIEAHSAS